MALKVITGNLIELAKKGKFTHIAHGCNCFHAMGAGIAETIAREFPEMYRVDRMHTTWGDLDKLGTYSEAVVRIEGGNFIGLNFYTQFQPGANFKLSALDLALYRFIYKKTNDAHLGVPWIGCGIGGGDMKQVKSVLSYHARLIDITVVNFKP